jgi:hypothetical protein
VNILDDNIDTVKKNTQTLIGANKEFDLNVNAEKTKYLLLSRCQNARQNHDIQTANRSFGNVTQFRYLVTAVTDQILIQEEIKGRVNSGNAWYCLSQNILLLSSAL